jgi:YcaO-like protein with predicted kinase domain
VTSDADLEHVAELYRRALTHAGRLTEFSLTPYDRTGLPVVATVLDEDHGDAHGVGYGLSPAAAAVGALGEVAERVLLQPTLRDLPARRASYAELVRELGAKAVADPVALILDAGAQYDAERPLWWVPAVRWRTGETVLVPAEFAAFDAASLPDGTSRDGLITPITNGLGAGDTIERAVGHGLLELVQRDGDNVVFRALDAGRVLDLDGASPAVHTVVDRLRAAGIDPVVKLASTEFAVVTYCAGRDADPRTPPIALSAIGEGAHPDRDTSVLKSLLEYASSRARRIFAFGSLDRVGELHPAYLGDELRRPVGQQEPRALGAMQHWLGLEFDALQQLLQPLFRHQETVGLAGLASSSPSTPEQLLRLMLRRLADFDVLVVASHPDRHTGMRAAKVLAPGLEVETMSYLRVGERAARQLLARGDGLVGRGPATGGRLPVRLGPDASERLGGPVWIDPAAVERAVGELYPLYREPRRHAPQRL